MRSTKNELDWINENCEKLRIRSVHRVKSASLRILSKDIQVNHLPRIVRVRIRREVVRSRELERPRGGVKLFRHPPCFLDFFLALGSGAVEGRAEAFTLGFLDEDDAAIDSWTASIALRGIGPAASRASDRSDSVMLGNIRAIRDLSPLFALSSAPEGLW